MRGLLLRYFRGRANFLEARAFERLMDAYGLAHASRIPSWTAPAELRALFDLASAAPPNAIVVEIGSHLGASTCYLGAGLATRGSGRLWCIDTWHNETMPDGVRDTYAEFSANTRALGARLTPVRKRSEALQAGDVPVPVHLAFIDGDHSYEAVRRDFDTVARWLATDGVIALHDFGNDDHEGVTRGVGEALASGRWVQRGLVETLVWITPARWTEPVRHADVRAEGAATGVRGV